jgi:hypothetical protein
MRFAVEPWEWNGISMKRTANGAKINLQEAVAILLHNQAQFISQMAESERRFIAIERKLAQIERMLYELPEAVSQKIGFKAK